MRPLPRLIVPEEYLTPEMAKLARALGFVDRNLRAFRPGELSAMKTAGMRVHYEVLGRGCRTIGRRYGVTHITVWQRLRRAGVQMRPFLRHYGRLKIHRLGIDQVLRDEERNAA